LAETPRGEAIRVLHIDDEQDQLEFIKIFMADIDPTIKIESTTSTSEALKKLNESQYDCIICDYQMPEMNGVDLAKIIRLKENTPIIIYTGRGSEEVVEAAFAAEVDDYIQKEATPGHYRVLAKNIRQIVEKKRLEELYRAVVEQGADPFTISDGFKIVYANKATAELVGVGTPDELIGRDLTEWFTDEDRERLAVDAGKMTLGAQQPFLFEASLKLKDGRNLRIESSVSIINFAGKPLHLIFTRDVTDKKRIEAELRQAYENRAKRLESERSTKKKFAALNRSAVELVRAESADSIYTTAIRTLDESLGFGWCGIGVVEGGSIRYRNHSGVNSPSDRGIPLDGRGVMVRAVKTMATQLVPDVRLDPDYVTARPEDVNLSELAVPIIAGGEVCAVINIEARDVNAFTDEDRSLVETLAMHIASALVRLREVEELKQSVTEKTQELLEASKMVAAGRVAATVAHDIKGPLQLIKNMVYLSKQRPDKSPEFMARIVSAVDYANGMIEGVRQATKEAPVVLVPTDLSKVIIEGARITEGSTNIILRLEVGDLGTQLVDAGKMRRVVENLVGNAVDAMSGGGTVAVSAKLEDDAITISVSDTGVGIPSEYLPRRFKAFESTKSQGMGLGLSFCKQTVEAHGGTIEVASEQGVGTTFTIRLPSRPAPG
jgi:PAS domain S-box-containing protein